MEHKQDLQNRNCRLANRSIKTATFTAESGKGYFCNTTSNEITANLPAGSAGAIVAFTRLCKKF